MIREKDPMAWNKQQAACIEAYHQISGIRIL